MNSKLHIPRIIKLRRRQNPLWLIQLARGLRTLVGKFAEYRRLRHTGLHRRASFWCAWNLK